MSEVEFDPVRNLCERIRIDTQMADNAGRDRPDEWILVHRIEVQEQRIQELEGEVTRNCPACSHLTGEFCSEHKEYSFDGGMDNSDVVPIADITPEPPQGENT